MMMFLVVPRRNTEDDVEVLVFYRKDFKKAQQLAQEMAAEAGEDYLLYQCIAKYEAPEPLSLSEYNGVKAGIDYPASFGK